MGQYGPMDPFWQTILFFLAVTVVSHVLFVWICPQSPRTWKKVDYVWIILVFLGGAGIILPAGEVRRTSASGLLPQFEKWATTSFEVLHHTVVQYQKLIFSGENTNCNALFVKAEGQSQNLDSSTKEYLLTCEWLRAIEKTLSQSTKDKFVAVKIEELPDVSRITIGSLRTDINDIKNNFIGSYEQNRRNFESVKRDTQKTESEHQLYLASPLILALALAIRLTKVSGELYHSS
jgi:hypothetical protein